MFEMNRARERERDTHTERDRERQREIERQRESIGVPNVGKVFASDGSYVSLYDLLSVGFFIG